jgi:hypothetical protein
MMTLTVLVEDLAVVAVIALFIWLVPMRRKGIPGLRGRGRPPGRPVTDDSAPGPSALPGPPPSAPPGPPPIQPGRVPPRPVPAAEQVSRAEAPGHEQPGHEQEQDRRILAELDGTWDADYADRVAAQLRDRRDSA